MSVAGDNAQIISVLELPPNAFYKILVNDESRYGTTIGFLLFGFIDFSAKVDITSPRHDKDLLI